MVGSLHGLRHAPRRAQGREKPFQTCSNAAKWWCLHVVLWSSVFPSTSGYSFPLTRRTVPTRRSECRGLQRHVPFSLSSSWSSVETNDEEGTYIRKYPNYRIPFTSSKEIKSREKEKAAWLPRQWFTRPRSSSVFQDWVASHFPKGKVTTRWMQITDSLSRNAATSVSESLQATVHFWRAVAEYASVGAPTATTVVGFGGSQPLLDTLLPLCDIQNWLVEQQYSTVSAQLESLEKDSLVVVTLQSASTMQAQPQEAAPPPEFVSPEDSKLRLRSWVKRILVTLGICPFTKSVDKSGQGLAQVGVPVANISYCHSNANTIPRALADTWVAIQDMMIAGPRQVSSILLAVPAFDNDFALWSGPFFTALEATVTAAHAEPDVGVVCFHPRYQVSDGSSWPGFGHMHSLPKLQQWVQDYDSNSDSDQLVSTLWDQLNQDPQLVAAGGAWQRRTPHAVVNVLRANQLELAEKVRQTTFLYPQNIQTLLLGKSTKQRAGRNAPSGVFGLEALEQALERERQMRQGNDDDDNNNNNNKAIP